MVAENGEKESTPREPAQELQTTLELVKTAASQWKSLSKAAEGKMPGVPFWGLC